MNGIATGSGMVNSGSLQIHRLSANGDGSFAISPEDDVRHICHLAKLAARARDCHAASFSLGMSRARLIKICGLRTVAVGKNPRTARLGTHLKLEIRVMLWTVGSRRCQPRACAAARNRVDCVDCCIGVSRVR